MAKTIDRPAAARASREAEAPGVCHVVYANGLRRAETLGPDVQVALYARCLHEGRPGLVELWAAKRTDRGAKLAMTTSRRDPAYFPRAGDQRAVTRLARRHREAGDEVFASPLTRAEPEPGKHAVTSGAVVWVDIDDAHQIARLRAFAQRPHLVVASGSGGVHAYWRLSSDLEGERIDAANRRLARGLGGDMQATDRGRSLRLPGTVNGKVGRSCRVVFADLAGRALSPSELLDALPADPKPVAEATPRRSPALAADEADRIAPPEYFRVLTGLSGPEQGGHVLCPLHEERTPSCLVYAEPERGWWCFGACGKGGRLYDLASALGGGPVGRELHGEAFLEARRWARAALGLER